MNNEIMQKINKGKRLSPLKSIKRYCKLMCSANDRESWQNCSFSSCSLFKYRLGIGNRAKKREQSQKSIPTQHNIDKTKPSGDRQEVL